VAEPGSRLNELLDGDGWKGVLEADGVLDLRFANPPVNAVNTAMWLRLRELLRAIRDDGAVRAIVLTSDHPKVFSAGIDFKELRRDDGGVFAGPGDRRLLVRETLREWYSAPVPIVSGVHGLAIGAGAVLPALSDLVVGGPGTTFTAAEIDRGVVGGSRFFARLVGEPLMRKMLLLGAPATGEELNRAGAFVEYVADDDITKVALETGRRLAEKHPVVMRLMKQAHVEVEHMGVIDGYAVEQKYAVIVPGSVRQELTPPPAGAS
jgi:enoyl-CoA hydratase/carnithine racemase